MDASQLWETTLNPETLILAQVSLSDTVEADEVTTLLMGSNVPPRRAFIVEEAKYAKLDLENQDLSKTAFFQTGTNLQMHGLWEICAGDGRKLSTGRQAYLKL